MIIILATSKNWQQEHYTHPNDMHNHCPKALIKWLGAHKIYTCVLKVIFEMPFRLENWLKYYPSFEGLFIFCHYKLKRLI
jgi:hypothetical protein